MPESMICDTCRAGVRGCDHRVRVPDGVEDFAFTEAMRGLEEQLLQISLDREIDHYVDRGRAALVGMLLHALIRALDRGQWVQARVFGRSSVGANRTAELSVQRFLNERGASERIAQSRQFFFGFQTPQCSPCGKAIEGQAA